MHAMLQWFRDRPALSGGLFVLVLSYFTFMHGYQRPAALFWDENYHIASAQKYLHGVYFMEPHPPLGKLLVALGEAVFRPNEASDQFLGTDYGRTLPEGFSFAGYRFFPTLMAWLTAVLFYMIFLTLTRRPLAAVMLSFLYVFDNALIVHNRSAMLDAPQLFFVSLALLAFLLLRERADEPRLLRRWSLVLGISFGCAMAIKANSLILILLFPALLLSLWPDLEKIGRFLTFSILSGLIVFLGIWYYHIAQGQTVNRSLPDGGYYQASEIYKEILNQGHTKAINLFPIMLREHLAFLSHYAKGVPRLDLCKADENGSPFFFWPVGGRSINYRWETPDGQVFRYLYLQVNPVVWWTSIAGVLLGTALFVLPWLVPLREPVERRFLLGTFLALYGGYMVAIARLDRVMYLYHYFIPLFFSFCILAIVVLELRRIGRWTLTDERRDLVLLVFGALIFFSYQIFRPLSYYEPITNDAVQRRAFFPLWELHCVHCDKESMLVVPRG